MTEAPKTAVVVNGNTLEKYFYQAKIPFNFYSAKELTYEFKLLDSCPVSNYRQLIPTKKEFEATLPKQYVREAGFWDNLTGKTSQRDGAFSAPKTAIVTNGDKFQAIIYTPSFGKVIEEGWFGSGTLAVSFKSEVINEAPISEVLAEFGL